MEVFPWVFLWEPGLPIGPRVDSQPYSMFPVSVYYLCLVSVHHYQVRHLAVNDSPSYLNLCITCGSFGFFDGENWFKVASEGMSWLLHGKPRRRKSWKSWENAFFSHVFAWICPEVPGLQSEVTLLEDLRVLTRPDGDHKHAGPCHMSTGEEGRRKGMFMLQKGDQHSMTLQVASKWSASGGPSRQTDCGAVTSPNLGHLTHKGLVLLVFRIVVTRALCYVS